jgi:hypothetical protein
MDGDVNLNDAYFRMQKKRKEIPVDPVLLPTGCPLEGLFGKWRNQVEGRRLKGILENFDL